MSGFSYKLGAIFYVVWGLLHFKAGYDVYMLGGTLEEGIVQGRIFQNAFFLLFFALFAIVIAIWFNWRNNAWGYWLNLAVIGIADIGFISYLLLPGHVPVVPGILGPAVWLLAVLFTTVGYLNRDRGIVSETP